MFTTAQYRVFAGDPSDRALRRPRHLLRDGDRTQAEAAYREVIAAEPSLKAGWAEYFQLLRAEGRFDDALGLAEAAAIQFQADAFSGALRGAALVEMGRLRDALEHLQASAEQDPDFGMVWHEMGYAAYRLGEHAHALLALDRAFALDPRSGTLHLRGKILREAGRYMAAEVAFAGAAEAAEFPEQKAEAERQIQVTRRAAHYRRRPSALSPQEHWFAEHGATILSRRPGPAASDEMLVMGFARLVEQAGWRFTVMSAAEEWSAWHLLAEILNLPLVPALQPAFGMVPLVTARVPLRADTAWQQRVRAVESTGAGLVFVLNQSRDLPPADVAGRLAGCQPGDLDGEAALAEATHPESPLANRRLHS